MVSENWTSGSRMNRWAMWVASGASRPGCQPCVSEMNDVRWLTIVHKALFDTFVNRYMRIMVFRQVPRVVRDIQVDRVVSRFRYSISIVLQWLESQLGSGYDTEVVSWRSHFQSSFFFCPIINTPSNHVPSRIYVG